MLAWDRIKDAFIGDATLTQSLVFKIITASKALTIKSKLSISESPDKKP